MGSLKKPKSIHIILFYIYCFPNNQQLTKLNYYKVINEVAFFETQVWADTRSEIKNTIKPIAK